MRKRLYSARFIIEDENGEVIASADTYEEAESVGGYKIIDTKLSNLNQSKIGKLHDDFINGNITEKQLKNKLLDEMEEDKVDSLIKKWSKKVIKSSVESAVGKAEDYFGTLSENNTVTCQNVITEADRIEMGKIAAENNVIPKIGLYSVTFIDVDDYLDTLTNIIE